MTCLLITGVSGLLGINLALEAVREGHEVVGWTHSRSLKGVPFGQETVSLENLEDLPAALQKARPNAVIHCAAVANLDEAEQNPQHTFLVNAQAPGVLARASKEAGIPFVLISTDAVFDGSKGNYSEEDQPNPQNTYAQSKLAGEQAVRNEYPEALVARVVFYGWSLSGKRSLAEFFFNNLSQGKQVKGFTDSIFSPLYARDLSDLLLEALSKDLRGTYHFFSRESLSKYDFGVALANRFGLDQNLITAVETARGDLNTPRSLNLSASSAKLCTALGHETPDVIEGLERMFEDCQNGLRQRLAAFLA
ncbi:MAG: SDR family oxidoreductase [Chloroflexi bacterium]|jgi:dTDP-4-dehydrorhamnose reductase|nr:SDR family oxidoreductase [Chloroflexota bacterium]